MQREGERSDAMRAWTAAIALLLGSWLALGGARDALASCPGGGAYGYRADGSATCPPPPPAGSADGVDSRAGGVAGVVDVAPAGPLAVAVAAPAALGPGYAVADEWVGGESFYGVLAERSPEQGGAGVAVLQIVQRLPTDNAAAQFFPAVAADRKSVVEGKSVEIG